MISQLHGTLVEATMSSAVVDVSGVGFELGISGSTAASLPTPGGEVRLYTRMQVRGVVVAAVRGAVVAHSIEPSGTRGGLRAIPRLLVLLAAWGYIVHAHAVDGWG